MQGITLQEVGGELVIKVPNEATIIGRGQFLQVTDKRVSRSHALLDVSEGKLYITPTHTNPCFLRKQGSKDQRALTRDLKQLLDHGDEFGLLPDQFFYKVSYPHVNGSESEDVKKEDIKTKEEGKALEDGVSNGISAKTKDEGTPRKKDTDKDLDKSRETSSSSLNTEDKKENKESDSENDDKEHSESEKVTVEGHGDMTLPLKKKRALPDWMVKVAESPTKVKPVAKKPKSAAVNKGKTGTKQSKSKTENEDDNGIDEEEEEYTEKASKKQAAEESDEDYEEEPSDDDYVPEKTSKKKGGKAQKRKRTSDSEEDLSDDDDDDDYSPKKSKPKASKKTPKGKGAARGKKTPSRASKSNAQRSRAKKKGSDDDDNDDEEEALPRRRRHEEEEDEAPLRRPQRAARQKRGSYVDDPMIEEALEDFASDNDNDLNEDKDSDFMVEGEEESGSDWEKSANSSQKQKASKSRSKGPPRGPTKRVAAKKKKPRRPSKAKENSDEDEDAMEDDEPYVPRPSKRRGGAVSHDSDESDEGGHRKKRRREPCQYGKKCYRKNPVHFRTYCHPGDSSFDEDDEKDSSGPKEVSSVVCRKEKESRVTTEKPSRPQRSTAGTRLVTHGAEDGLPDDNDEGAQHTDESGADDSDFEIEDEVQEHARDAKKHQKNKKLAKPVGSD